MNNEAFIAIVSKPRTEPVRFGKPSVVLVSSHDRPISAVSSTATATQPVKSGRKGQQTIFREVFTEHFDDRMVTLVVGPWEDETSSSATTLEQIVRDWMHAHPRDLVCLAGAVSSGNLADERLDILQALDEWMDGHREFM